MDPKTGRYALPENGGVPMTVGHDGKFERTRHSRVNEYPGWNTLEVIVRGDRATHIVNGVTNMRVYDLKGWDAATTPGSRWITARSRCRPRARRSSIATSACAPLTDADDLPPDAEDHRGVVPGAARR